MFDDADSPFMTEFQTKLDELSAEDKAAALNAATAVFKKAREMQSATGKCKARQQDRRNY